MKEKTRATAKEIVESCQDIIDEKDEQIAELKGKLEEEQIENIEKNKKIEE